MALTTTQVNQAFLGLLGRPATGAEAAKFAGQLDAATLAQTLLTDASFKNELSVETLSFKTVDLLNTDPAAFVESLYTALLGRASDAEGKAFWLSVAGATPNRADVVSQFIAAVQAQEGTADANAFAAIQAEDKALASAWVESLYNNLAGRASDAEGLDFWTNAIVSFTMTPAQVAASFAAALALQGNTTEDGQNYLAKQGVADNFTANFKDFSTLVTANEKAEQLKNLVTMMNGVNKDSQVDQYTEEITKITDEYQKIAAVQFTAADDDNLGIDPETGESNLKGAANFTGTYNLTDAAKGTIQSSDSATGTEAYLTDTLTINVTGYDKTTHDTFNLSELPSTTSIEKLKINNGAATVSGSISGDFEYINVNGTGSFNIDATTSNTDGFKDIVLNSAANKDGQNTFATAQNAVSIKAGAGNDKIDLSINVTTAATEAATITKSLSTGAGKDTVIANIGKDATADLGAGDDAFSGALGQAAKLNAGAGDDLLAVWGAGYRSDNNKNPIAEVEIDGGTGTDTLDLTKGKINGTDQNIDYLGVKSIKGIEKMIVGNGTTLYANAISGQKIELSGTSLVLNASGASTIDLTKLSNAKDEDVAVRITNVKNGSISLETGNKNFNAIKETIELSSEATKVSVKGFEKGNDHVAIENATATTDQLFTHSTAGTTTGINTNLVNANEIFFVSLKEKITKNDLNKLLNTATFSNLKEKDVFYVVATDSEEHGGAGRNSTAKIYKIEVGKDQTVAKVDQVATVNVADKAQLSIGDFYNTPVPVENVEVADVTVVNGTLDLSGKVISDANAEFNIDLSTNPNVATITSVKLPADITAKNLVISGANSANPVTVEVSANSVIETLTVGGVNNQTTPYNVVVDASAKVSAISTNNADNSIDISALPAGTVKVVNAGEGNDTLKIAGTSADNLTEMNSVERVEFTGTSINADAIVTNNNSGVSALAIAQMKSATAQELEIKVGQNNNIDLSKLVQATDDSGDASLKITGVKDGNVITLTTTADAAHTFAETVALGTAKNVTVKGIATGDKVVSDSFSGITGGFKDLGAGSLTANGAFFKASNAATAAAAQTEANTAAATLTSGKAILALNGTANATYIFEVNNGVATLVATVNDSIDAKDSIANGEITFDNGIVPPAPAKTYDFVKDLGSPASITVGKEYNGTLVEFDSDGLLSISNIDSEIEIKQTGVTAANTINLVSSADNINFKIKVPTIATTSLTLAANATVSNIESNSGIDTLVLNGNNEIVGAQLTKLAQAKATIATTSNTDAIVVTSAANLTGLQGSANINAIMGASAFSITKGKTYTGDINVTLTGNETGALTITATDDLSFANSIAASKDLATLNVHADALTKLKGKQIDLSQSDVTVTLNGTFNKTLDINEYFTGLNANDEINFGAAQTTITKFIGSVANETIDLSGNTAITSIDGGEGTADTITLGSGTGTIDHSKLTSITNVEKITINNAATVTLNALALSGSNAELTLSAVTDNITLNAADTKGQAVNLSGLTKAYNSSGSELKIANVKNDGTVVTLSNDFTESVTIADNQRGDIDLSKIVVTEDANDTVAITLGLNATSLTGSKAADTITISGNYVAAKKLKSISGLDSNDTVAIGADNTTLNASVINDQEFKLTAASAHTLKLIADTESIDLGKITKDTGASAYTIDISGIRPATSAKEGTGQDITLTKAEQGIVENITIGSVAGTYKVTNLKVDATQDTITLGASDDVAGNTTDFKAVDSAGTIFTTTTTAAKAKIATGLLTFQTASDVDVSVTLTEALLFLNTGKHSSGTAFGGANKAAVFKAADGKSYLISTGATKAASDDIAIELVGVTTLTKLEDAAGVFTVTGA